MNKRWENLEYRPRRKLTQPTSVQIQRQLFPPPVLKRISKIENLKTIQIQNFKSIINETLELKTGTFLSGFNSAGKSSFTHALLLVIQWLENLTSGQSGKVPINGPLIQLGTSAESILNRTVQSRNNEKSPSIITLTWNENDEFTQIIVFKLSTDQSSSAELQLEEVSITHKVNRQKVREKEWKYKYENKIITNGQRAVGWYAHKKLHSNPYSFVEESVKVINQLEKLNTVKKNPYLVIKETKDETHRRKYLFHPSEVNITENQPGLSSGFENDEIYIDNTDSSLVSRVDLFKFLIFKKFCQILLDTPVELDQEFNISQMLYQIRNKKIRIPEELKESFVIKDLFSFDIQKNFLDDLQYKLENLEIIDLESELSDSINKDLESYVVEKNLLNIEEFIPDDKKTYIDSINFAELLNLYNITAHKPDKTSDIIELENQIKKNQRYVSGRFFEGYTSLREFQADDLLKHLDIKNKKEHKSVNEDDAFADELVDLLSSDLNLISLIGAAFSKRIDRDEDLRESELIGNFSRAIRSYLFATGELEETVFEIYEKQQSITNPLPNKVKTAYINFQDNFINSTEDLDNEIDELLNLHEQTKENEILNFNKKIEKFKNEIFDAKEEMFILDAKRESLLKETLTTNDDIKINKNIRNDINDLNKNIENTLKKLEKLENEKNKTVDELNKLTKEGMTSEDTNFSYFLSDQKKLDNLIDQKATNLFKGILNSCLSNINKIETYTLLKLLVPNFLDNDILKEYQQDITSNLAILEVDHSTSVEDLLNKRKLILLPKEKDPNADEEKDFRSISYYANKRGDSFTFFSGNPFYSDFNFLSATRNVSNLNSGRYYGGNNISPLGSSSEFLTNYLNIHKKDKYISPLPQSYLDGLARKLSDNALHDLPLSQHIDIWSSFIFGNEMKVIIDETAGLNLMVGEDTIENVGSGVNQVLPIIVQLIISKGKMLLLEEVEQNLHPQAQANLADMIITFAKHGRKILVETHSDHLINRLRLRIVENTEEEKDIDISIYFTDIDEINGTKLLKMDINENGEFITDKIPEGFFDQPQKDTIQILKALKKKKT